MSDDGSTAMADSAGTSTTTTSTTDTTDTAAPAVAQPTLQQRLAAEVVGTFVLVLFGCGSVAYASQAKAVSTVTTIGLTFGLAVMVMAYAFGRISGAHFNPAVSVGAAVGGRMRWSQAGFYIAAQLVGAILGALVLFILLHGFSNFDSHNNMGQNGYGDQTPGNYAWWAAFLLELVLTAVFVVVILAVTDERNDHPSFGPLAIGLTLAAIHFVAIPATGTSVNPARSIGPALFAGGDAIVQLWLFILAPLIGGAIAGAAYPAVFGRASDPVPGSGWQFARPRTAAQLPGYGAPDQYQQQWNQESPVGAGGSAGAADTGHAASYAAPIIQDGWQWDPIGQQWHPVGQTPEQWRAQQAAQQQAAQQTQQFQQPETGQWGQGQHSGWPEDDSGEGGTQIRPPAP